MPCPATHHLCPFAMVDTGRWVTIYEQGMFCCRRNAMRNFTGKEAVKNTLYLRFHERQEL
ncbi:MAG: hypothetical protein B6D35_06790 [Candidatus Brocadia sp. UTAMX2]|jgi:hypothetical protein|nr:MAG: hypothetical protein B6D35_06790 [Candidatus Brocadia sp. UTAMX2]